METKLNTTNDTMQQAQKALQRMFFHYSSTVSDKTPVAKAQHWSYLGFALAVKKNYNSR